MLLFLEGFEGYGASAGAPVGLNTTWTLSGSHISTDLVAGRVSGLALRLTSGVAVPDIRVDVGSHSALLVGFAYRPGNVLNVDGRAISLREGDTDHVSLRVQSHGEVSIYRGSTHLATSNGAGLFGNAWCFIEVKATIHNSTGAYEVRVNGITVLSATNVDTQNGGTASIDNVRFHGNNSSDSTNRVTFDDIYIADLTAGEVDDFIGSHKVTTAFPTGAGDDTDFTPSAGNNWECVDDNPHDGDASYVESAASADRDLYNFTNVALTDIKGVQVSVVCRETDATPFSLKPLCKSDGTLDTGSAIAIGSTSYVDRRYVFEVDPDTAAAWHNSGLNAAQFGVEIA